MGNEKSDFISDYLRFSAWAVAIGTAAACIAVALIFYHVTLHDFARSIRAGIGNLTSDALRDGVSADNEQGLSHMAELAGPLIAGGGFLTIRVYDQSGAAVFSAPTSASPTLSPLDAGLLERALEGEAVARPVLVENGGVFHLAFPLKALDGGPSPGVFIATRPMTVFLAGTVQAIGLLMAVIVLSSGIVFLLIWTFARRAKRELKREAAVASALQVRLADSLTEAELQAVGTLQALSAAVDAKDVYTSQHSLNVADYACAIAREMGREDLGRELERAGLLHDIGKIGVSETLLQKPSTLTEEEFAAVAEHSTLGADIIRTIPFLMGIVPAVAHHHERWDGTGYPDGLSGEQIPLTARILATADAFDAMTTDRPYRAGMPVSDALMELKRCRGEQFDPEIADALVAIVESGRMRIREAAGRTRSVSHR